MMGLFDCFFGASEREVKEAFDTGYKAGREVGIREGMSKNFERTTGLSEAEYKEVIEFLVKRGLELCCYDVDRGGFQVRKRRYHERV
jgi:phosphosulfolactate synthase (CoM biosynthesis protein A)